MKAEEKNVEDIKKYFTYFIYKDGLIINEKTGRTIKQRLNHNGYWCVNLSINGKDTYRFTHRLVAELYIPNPHNKPQVNHKDRDRKNCNVDNLEWCTSSENVKHSVINGGRIGWRRNNEGELNGNSKLNWSSVLDIRKLAETGKYKRKELADMFNITECHLRDIVKNRRWKQELTLTNKELK